MLHHTFRGFEFLIQSELVWFAPAPSKHVDYVVLDATSPGFTHLTVQLSHFAFGDNVLVISIPSYPDKKET